MRLPSTGREAGEDAADGTRAPTLACERQLSGLLVALAIGAFSVVGAIGAAVFALSPGAGGPRITAAAIAAVFVGSALSIIPAAFRGLRAGAGPLVAIGPDGILDRRIASRAIPWRAVTAARTIRVMNRRSLMIEVDTAARAALGMGFSIPAAFNRAFGYPGYTIGRAGIAASSHDLIRAMLRHIEVAGADPHLRPAGEPAP